MNTLITFDLDYWTMTESSRPEHFTVLRDLMSRANKVLVVSEHHHIITRRMIPQDTEHVINIDFHNDIVDESKYDLNEGTWGNHMPKSVKNFTWVYPDEELCINLSRGVCIGEVDGHPEISHVEYQKVLTINNLIIPKKINKFVICISAMWADHPITPYLEFLKEARLLL
jgi:hypothetical protein